MHGRWIIPELDVKPGLARVWDVQSGIDEADWHGSRVRELLVRSDGVDQEQVAAGESARFVGAFGTADFLERGHTDEVGERLPVAFGAVGSDGAESHRSERGRTKGFA